MLDHFPNLKAYFNYLNIYMLGDLLVFDKNCQQADESDAYYHTSISGRPMETLYPDKKVSASYSSIYPRPTKSSPNLVCEENPNPRLTIPLALTLFSAIELLGIFFTGRTDPGSTTVSMTTFFEKLPASHKPKPSEISTLIKMYRHGMVHQYFAKKGCQLAYGSLCDDKLFVFHETWCLNVGYLKKLFLLGFEKIKEDQASFGLMETNILKLNQNY